jgi:hypothetical protein
MSNNFSFNESCRVNVVLMKFLRNCTFQPKFESTYRTAILKVRTVRTSHLRVREGYTVRFAFKIHMVWKRKIIKESYIGQKLEDMNGSNSPMHIQSDLDSTRGSGASNFKKFSAYNGGPRSKEVYIILASNFSQSN